MQKWRYGCAPMAGTPLVGNNRKLRFVGHAASDNGPRAYSPEMSTPTRRAGLADGLDRCAAVTAARRKKSRDTKRQQFRRSKTLIF
jgi:hypothetical protein